MNVHEVEDFLRLQPLLKSAYDEISLLAKNNPAQTVSFFKLKLINTLLKKANEVLVDDNDVFIPFPEDFTEFSENDTPNASDTAFILSSYLSAMERMRCENIEKGDEFPRLWYWTINGKISLDDETNPPTIK
jgi:hypothetical protein